MRHLVDQPLSFFHEHRTGDLMARATNDLGAVRQLAGPVIMYSLQTIFVVILVLPLMFMLNWWLTLLLFVTMPLVSLTVKFFGQQVHSRFEKIQEFFGANHGARAGELQRRASGARVRTGRRRDGGLQQSQLAVRGAQSRPREGRGVDAPVDDVPDWVWLRADYLGGRAARGAWRDHSRRVHDVQSLSHAADLAFDRARLRRESLSTRDCELEETQRDPARSSPPSPTRRAWSSSHRSKGRLNFAISRSGITRTDEPVIKDLTLTIPAGHTVAFVGRTGSGKSTIANLIPRLIEAPANTLFIDGVRYS